MENKRIHKKSKSLQSKLLIRILAIIVALVSFLGLYQFYNMREYLYSSKVEFLDSRFKNIDKEIIIGITNEELLEKNTKLILNEIAAEGVCVSIIDKTGEMIATKNTYTGIATETSKLGNNTMSVPEFKKEEYLSVINSKGFAEGYYIITDNDEKKQIVIWRQIGPIDNPTGLIQLSAYIESANKILIEQTRVYFLSALFVMIVGSAVIILVLKDTLKPLKEITKVVANINTDSLNNRLNEESGLYEIDKLANRFNHMFNRLEDSFIKEKLLNEKMKNFVLDASHELRTPLTSIQGFVEVLQMGAAKNQQQLDLALNSILSESKRLSNLVNKLLLLSKLERDISTELKKENINGIINEIYPQLKIMMKERELKLSLNEYAYCLANKDQIKQVIFNLVQNAVNYTDDVKGIIEINTNIINKNEVEYVQIMIKDNGIGIPKENLKDIFDRFYRIDKHRSRKSGGYGLGLSIVKSIVENHNGEIYVESEINYGTQFYVLLKI